MNERQIGLVQRSFTKVAPEAMSASESFYRKLFEIAPHLRQLFVNDIDKQGKMLIKVLSMAVNSLYDLSAIENDLISLGVRHIHYGVKEEHYDDLEVAFIHMLEQVLGADFDEELNAAWQSVYKTITDIMKGECYTGASELSTEL